MSNSATSLIKFKDIEQAIFLIRGQRVMLDADLARLYGVATRVLIQAMKRNHDRFPKDFVFQLTRDEILILRSQSVISRPGHGGRRTPPYAFTEHGAIMLASVLNSPAAVQASIQVVRVFVRLRALLANHSELAIKLNELEQKIITHDEAIRSIFEAIRQLTALPEESPSQIGFRAQLKK